MYGTVARTHVKPENRDEARGGHGASAAVVHGCPRLRRRIRPLRERQRHGLAVRDLRGPGVVRQERRRPGPEHPVYGGSRPHGGRSRVARRGDRLALEKFGRVSSFSLCSPDARTRSRRGDRSRVLVGRGCRARRIAGSWRTGPDLATHDFARLVRGEGVVRAAR